jgi:hypothetical protein
LLYEHRNTCQVFLSLEISIAHVLSFTSLAHRKETSMPRIRVFLLAIAVMAVFAHGALAATNVWTANFPQTGTTTGTILISGTVTPDANGTLVSVGSASVWVSGACGGTGKTFRVQVNQTTGAWSATIPNLMSGVTYNVVVQVHQRHGEQSQAIATTPATATAK